VEGKNNKGAKINKLRKIANTALFAALTAVGAQIAIPVGNVPITLQMFFVFLSGFLLSPFEAMTSMLLYLTLGALGLPVFANFSGGIAHLVGPTSGYLWAFPISAFLIAQLRRKFNTVLSGIVGLVVVYIIGWIVLGLHIGGYRKAFIVGVIPFVLIDFAKLFFANLVALKIDKVMRGKEYGQT
jgi:biotin transport system substrate-specific component